MSERVIASTSSDVTRAVGEQIGNAFAAGHWTAPVVIALSGELGAGKTTMISGLLRAMGVEGPVRSPTYTLIEPYEELAAGFNVYHLDLYRLQAAADLEMLALRDVLVPGSLILVEWPERGGTAVPTPDLTVAIRYPLSSDSIHENHRSIALRAHTRAGELLIHKPLAEFC